MHYKAFVVHLSFNCKWFIFLEETKFVNSPRSVFMDYHDSFERFPMKAIIKRRRRARTVLDCVSFGIPKLNYTSSLSKIVPTSDTPRKQSLMPRKK